MEFLPTFGVNLWYMQVDRPYIEHLGFGPFINFPIDQGATMETKKQPKRLEIHYKKTILRTWFVDNNLLGSGKGNIKTLKGKKKVKFQKNHVFLSSKPRLNNSFSFLQDIKKVVPIMVCFFESMGKPFEPDFPKNYRHPYNWRQFDGGPR